MCGARRDATGERALVFGDDVAVPPFPITTAHPADAVPKGRISYDISADSVLLHTIQTGAAFEALLTTGVLVPDNALAEPLYADAYAWMYRQMATRLATEGDGAIWFWARIGRQNLADLCRRADGEVLLTCRVPRERVLLSHFVDWHAVLNGRTHVPDLPDESDDEYVARMERILDDFDQRIRAAGLRGKGIQDWPAGLRTEMEESWEDILEPANYGRFESWQGTMHTLRAEDVVAAVRLER